MTTLAFGPDGQRVASLDRGGLVKIWSPDTGQEFASWQLDGDNIDVAAFSPDLRYLAWFSPFSLDPAIRDAIQVWDLTTGKPYPRNQGSVDQRGGVQSGR